MKRLLLLGVCLWGVLGLRAASRAEPERLAISFSLWALYDMGPGGHWNQLDSAMIALKERGFNAVRIDDGAGLYCAPDGTPRGPVTIYPPFGKFAPDIRQNCAIQSCAAYDPKANLVRFCRAAKRHGVKVILSSWFYIHTNWMVDETINRQLWDELDTEGKLLYFADEHNRALAALRENGLLDAVAFVELLNEFDGLCFTANYGKIKDPAKAEGLRALHEQAIARMRKANPEACFGYDASSADIQENLVPRNVDVLNFHDYYFWSVYTDVLDKASVRSTVTEIPIPPKTRQYLRNPPVTIAEVVAERRGNLRISNDWNARVRLYASLDDAKLPALEQAFETRFRETYANYVSRFARDVAAVVKVRDAVVPSARIVYGEGVSYCGSNRFLFEEHNDLYWKMLLEQSRILRDAGVWGAVPRTLSGPEDPAWTLRAADLKRVNEAFRAVAPMEHASAFRAGEM